MTVRTNENPPLFVEVEPVDANDSIILPIYSAVECVTAFAQGDYLEEPEPEPSKMKAITFTNNISF